MVAERYVPVRSVGSTDQQQSRISGEAEETREPARSCGVPRAVSHRAAQLSGIIGQVRQSVTSFQDLARPSYEKVEDDE